MKKFYEYTTSIEGYPLVNEVTYPHCPSISEDAFLIYATDKDAAFKLAMDYLYKGKKMVRFYGTYNGERYENILCVM